MRMSTKMPLIAVAYVTRREVYHPSCYREATRTPEGRDETGPILVTHATWLRRRKCAVCGGKTAKVLKH